MARSWTDACGLTSGAIATRMGISVKTVQYSVSGILPNLGVADRGQAVAVAYDAEVGISPSRTTTLLPPETSPSPMWPHQRGSSSAALRSPLPSMTGTAETPSSNLDPFQGADPARLVTLGDRMRSSPSSGYLTDLVPIGSPRECRLRQAGVTHLDSRNANDTVVIQLGQQGEVGVGHVDATVGGKVQRPHVQCLAAVVEHR